MQIPEQDELFSKELLTTRISLKSKTEYETKVIQRKYTTKEIGHQKMKYILLWTPTISPFNFIRKRGQIPFITNDCEYQNCFLTHRRSYFSDMRRFDAVAFSIPALKNITELPSVRSPKQKFIAVSFEPPQKHPVVNPIFDNYFNWTWTYRLNSDILWRKFRIYNSNLEEIGPKKQMKWLTEQEDPVNFKLNTVLSLKHKSVAWIRYFCVAEKHNNEQLQYIGNLEKELNDIGLTLVKYSNCSGYDSCGDINECSNKIQEFYFYLAFEDYIDEDYVETLLFAIQNTVVPVVYGGSNYSRFLPPGSYVDARSLSPREVANIIDSSMTDFTIFREYFKWKLHYIYLPTGSETEVCNICAVLNSATMVKKITVYEKFRKMWKDENSMLIANLLFKVFEEDKELKNLVKNGSYSDIRLALAKKHFPETQDDIYVFDKENLNVTSTEVSFFMPEELTATTLKVDF